MQQTEEKPKIRVTLDLLSHQRTVLMGISILLIICFHFTEDCMGYDVHYHGIVKWYKTFIGSSSVDMFFFLSGLGLYYAMKKNSDILRFYKRRLVKVIIPYLMVAIPAWIIMDCFLKPRGYFVMLEDISFASFFTEGVRWYWYIGAIMLFYLIYPPLFHLIDKLKKRYAEALLFLVLCTGITVLAKLMQKNASGLYEDINIVFLRIPVFLAGCFYGKASYEKRNGYWMWGILAVICILLSPQLEKSGITILQTRYLMGALNVSVGACLAVLLDKFSGENIVMRILSWFGCHSLELYLTHVTVRKIMKVLGYRTCYGRYELFMVAVSIVLAWLLQRITNYLFRERMPIKSRQKKMLS